jgi:hypothetical protein
MSDMGPRFMDPLHFQSDHSLDVCGPTRDADGGTQLNITRLVIADHKGNIIDHVCDPPVIGLPGQEWETDLDGADQTLQDGAAIGLAIGYVDLPGGGRQDVSWAQALQLTHKAAAASGDGEVVSAARS